MVEKGEDGVLNMEQSVRDLNRVLREGHSKNKYVLVHFRGGKKTRLGVWEQAFQV